MRWPVSLSVSLLLGASTAISAAQSNSPDLPTVYLYDPESPSLQSDAQLDRVNAHVASLIIADRLDIAQYLSIGAAGDVDLQHLNKYSAASSKKSLGKHLFAVVDNARVEKDCTTTPGLTAFHLSVSPTTEDGKELSQKFTSYATQSHGGSRQDSAILRREIEVTYEDGISVDDLLKTMIESRMAFTLVVNPKPATGSGSKQNIYGELPSADGKTFGRRQEAPLLEPISVTNDDSPPISSQPQTFATNATKFPLTAQCYDTADSCMSETNSCSGHGECVLARKAPASGEDEGAECYQCKCGSSQRKNEDGSIKTTYYGGSACQKEDISAPFWLLTITAGSLLALVGFGVSMLYAMGNVELPSVIGAGVSGPKAK